MSLLFIVNVTTIQNQSLSKGTLVMFRLLCLGLLMVTSLHEEFTLDKGVGRYNTLANSEDPDEMEHNAAFHWVLLCLLRLKQL